VVKAVTTTRSRTRVWEVKAVTITHSKGKDTDLEAMIVTLSRDRGDRGMAGATRTTASERQAVRVAV
jgi:hypothetical protein